MNPEFLESEELDYEMSIRKIYLDTRRKKTSALYKILAEEKEGLRPLPSYTGLDPEEEILTCGVLLDLLKLSLEVAINQRDENELRRCHSKFLHIHDRTERIIPVTSTSMRLHVDLMSSIKEVEKKFRSPTQTTIISHNVTPISTTTNYEPSNPDINLLLSTNNRSSGDLMSNQAAANSITETASASFDPLFTINEQVTGLPIPIIPTASPFRNSHSTNENDINKRFERLEDMIEKLTMSISEKRRSEPESRPQQNPLREPPRENRNLGAIPRTSQIPPPSRAQTWGLPTVISTTASVEHIQRDLCPNTIQRNNQGRFPNNNGLNFENQFRPQQQNPYYPNEQARFDPSPRFDPNPRYNHYHQQAPLLNSSFINDNINQNHSNQRSSHGQNSFHGGRKPIPVHKWRISFDGENDLNDFLSKVEMYTKFESTPDDVLMSSIGYLFAKRALSWYRVHYKEYERWADLRCALIEEFLPSHSDFQITNQINSRFQLKNESFGEYLSAMQILFSYMSEPPNHLHQLQLIRRNMDPTYMFALSTQDITTVKQLAQICRRLDDTKDMIQMRNKSSNNLNNPSNSFLNQKKVQFNELSGQLSDSDLEVAAFTIQKRNEKVTPNEQFSRKTPPIIACWNCLKTGHTFNYCPQEKLRLFCFTCGMHNTSRPKCPKCSPGNQRPGSPFPK